MGSYRQIIKILVRNLFVQFIFGGVQLSLTPETSGRGCSPNVVKHRLVTGKRLASPIGADQIEHTMFNRVPFGSTSRIMGNRDNQSKFIGQLLETHFPNAAAVTIGTTTVGLDQPMLLTWIEPFAYRQPPGTKGGDRKLRGIVRSADRDKALIVSDVVNAVESVLKVVREA